MYYLIPIIGLIYLINKNDNDYYYEKYKLKNIYNNKIIDFNNNINLENISKTRKYKTIN